MTAAINPDMLLFDSIDDLKERATVPSVEETIRIKTYFRTAAQMFLLARSYGVEGNVEYQYIYLTRYVTLLLKELPGHPEFKNKELKAQRKDLTKKCAEALSTLEALKEPLEEAYAYLATIEEGDESDGEESHEDQAGEAGGAHDGVAACLHVVDDTGLDDRPYVPLQIGTNFAGVSQHPPPASVAGSVAPLPATAVTTTTSTTTGRVDGDVADGCVAEVGAAASYPSAESVTSIAESSPYQAYVPHAQQQAYIARLRQEQAEQEAQLARMRDQEARAQELDRIALERQAERERIAQEYRLAEEARRQAAASLAQPAPPVIAPVPPSQPAAPPMVAPQRPPPPTAQLLMPSPAAVPAGPAPTSTSTSVPTPDKPKRRSSRGRRRRRAAKKEGPRKVVITMSMLSHFLQVASKNTRANLETCGILCGVCHDNVLYVTTLVIPKQEATSDTVHTTDEEELWEYQMTNDLLTLGWIHTHPTQQCFMSSVDVHTHCAYQSMLPEAIAIVMAPRYKPNYGIFQLTTPQGLKTIQKCRKTGFHPHPAHIKIYDHATHVLVGNTALRIVDLRGSSVTERDVS